MRAKIKDLADIATGYHFRGRVEDDPNGKIAVVQAKDVDWEAGRVATDLTRVTLDKDPSSHVLRPGDVLFLSRGHRHPALPIDASMPELIAPGYFFILRGDRAKVLPEYLAWYINYPATQEMLKNMAKGTQIPFLSVGDFGLMAMPLPTLATQERIVTLARLARQERELLARLADRRQVLLNGICMNLADVGEPS